jgi:hypothetical protein
MKHLWIVSVFLVAFSTGCAPTPSGSTSTKEDIKKAAEKLKEAIKAEAEVFHKEAKEHLTKLDKQYEAWKARAAEAKGEAKELMAAKLADLDKQKAKVNEQLGKLKGVSDELWKEAKKDAQKAVDELKESYEKAKEHFKGEKLKEPGKIEGEKTGEPGKVEAEAFHKEAKEHLDRLDKQHEEWKAKAVGTKGTLREKMDSTLAVLDRQKARVKEQLGKLKDANDELWKEAKKDAQKALDELKAAYEKASEHFK